MYPGLNSLDSNSNFKDQPKLNCESSRYTTGKESYQGLKPLIWWVNFSKYHNGTNILQTTNSVYFIYKKIH